MVIKNQIFRVLYASSLGVCIGMIGTRLHDILSFAFLFWVAIFVIFNPPREF